MKGVDLGTSEHAPNRTVKPNMQGVDLGTSEDAAARNVIPNLQGQVQVQQHEQNQETAGLQGQWISCGAIRADIAGKLETITSNLRSDSFGGIPHEAGVTCGPGKSCVEANFAEGWPAGILREAIYDKINEIRNYIQCENTITCGVIRSRIVDRLDSVTNILHSLPQQAWAACGGPKSEPGECIRDNFDRLLGEGGMMKEKHDKIREIHDYIDARC